MGVFIADGIVSKSDLMSGVDGSKHAFVIRDIFSGFCHALPTRTRTTEDTVELFKLFVGPHEKGVFKLHSDVGRELIATAR